MRIFIGVTSRRTSQFYFIQVVLLLKLFWISLSAEYTLCGVQRKNTPELMNGGVWCELIVCALHRYASCVCLGSAGDCTWSIALELHATLVGNVADWSFHISGELSRFQVSKIHEIQRIHRVHITV